MTVFPPLYNGPTLPTPKIVPSHGGFGPHLIHGSLDPSKFITQTASQSVQPFLQGFALICFEVCRAHDCDRQTDRQTKIHQSTPFQAKDFFSGEEA